MRLKSPKAKGSKFEREIAKSLRDAGLDLYATRQILSGSAFGLPSDVKTSIPLAIEAKFQNNTSFKEWYKQAERQANKSKIPVVVWKENYGLPFVFLKWDDLLEIMNFALIGGWADRLPFHK